MSEVYCWVDFDGENHYENSITEEYLIQEMYEEWKHILILAGHPVNSKYLNVDTFLDWFVVNHWAEIHESVLS